MSRSLQLGYPNVPKSITNPNVDNKNAIDVGHPMSFLDFIKNINISLEPETLQEYYNLYINNWNNITNVSPQTSKNIIIERYRDFLKDIIIQYSTLEEKKFLTSINFNDPLDLDIALNFYSKKLRDICNFHNKKREDLKHGVLKRKLEGSNFKLKQTIKELVISYIKNIEDSKISFDMGSVIPKLEIEIEELYDTYPIYYNQIPNEKIYDNKDLDYNLNIFLKNNEELIDEIFQGVSDDLVKLKEANELIDNKRKLTQKYTSTDFYFLSTGNTSTNFLSGKLFDNENTITNFLNRYYPTTASTKREEYLKSPREKGFFKPTNVSFVLINGANKSFSIDASKLHPNTLYFFPDPHIFGENLGIISFSIDDVFLKRNTTSGNAKNEPSSSPSDTKYYGYYSYIDPTEKKYLDSLYNSGYIKDFKQDIYGNSYGLFKSGFNKYLTNIDTTDITTTNIIFNGYEFYDSFYNEGRLFNYFTVDNTTFTETIRTGLSSRTLGFSNFEPDINLTFGKFKPYYEIIEPTEDNLKKTYRYIDGIVFTRRDLSLLPDPISSDLYSYEFSSGEFYYDVLIEGGIASNSPQQRALLDVLYPSLTAKFIDYDRLSGFVVDGGRFEESFNYSTISNNSIFINENINNTELMPISSFDTYDGNLFIKNNVTKEILHIFDCLPHIQTAYPTIIVNQLNSIQKFEICYDTISIETPNYIIFEKIVYNNYSFHAPKLGPKYEEHSSNPFNKISNRIKIKDSVYYVITEYTGDNITDNLKVYPKIYRYNTTTNKNILIYPTSNDISDLFLVSNDTVVYQKVDTPILTYSSRNNILSLAFLLKDQNNYPLIKNYDFILSPNVEFIKKKDISLTNDIISNSFHSTFPTTLSVYLSATTSTSQDILII